MGTLARHPITRAELEAYRKTIKIGDRLIYPESLAKKDGGTRIVKIPMEVTKIYRNIVILRSGRKERSMTIQEALLHNAQRKPPKKEERQKGIQDRNKKIMDLLYRGISRDEIARKTGYSLHVVSGVIQAAARKKEKISGRHARIIKLKQEGHGVNEIARLVGCSGSTVIRVIRKQMEAGHEHTI